MSVTQLYRGLQRSAVLAVLTAITAVSAGCATVAHGRWQDVAISSDPPGADLFVNDQHIGTTPLTLSFKRSAKHIVLRFAKQGFTDATVALKRSTSAWIAGDFAIAFDPLAAQGLNSLSEWPAVIAKALAFTLGIDVLTGAAYKLPGRVQATLSPAR